MKLKTLLESIRKVNEGQNNPVDKKFIRAWEKLCSAMIGRLKIDMRQAPVESKFLFTKNIKRIEDVLDIPTEISYFTEGKVNEGSSIINNIQFDDSFFDADHEWMVKNKIKLSQVINKAIADSMIIQNADEEGKTITLSLR